MNESEQTIMEARGVHKAYGPASQRLRVLKGIDFVLQEGEVVAVVGPSGAGKSTLLHIMGGLDAPDEGQIFLEGQDIYRLKDQERANIRNQKFGFIFQFYHLLAEFSALENVMLPALIKDSGAAESTLSSRAESLLEQVGLKERLFHKPSELSGGEQQRVAIARALVNSPRVILCDEPTGNLDSESGQKVIDLLLDLNRRNRQTLVIVTHDENIARRAHRVVPLRDGSICVSNRSKR